MSRILVGVLVLTAGLAVDGVRAQSPDLGFEERVEAQRAIERVYHAHRTGETRPFAQAVPRAVLERKVRTYLAQSMALERYWHTPVTAAALRRELERIARDTRFPRRLEEIYAALDHDPLLVLECLARPVLVDRLARSFFASDERIHGTGREDKGGTRRTWDEWWDEVRDVLAFEPVTVPAPALQVLPHPGGPREGAAADTLDGVGGEEDDDCVADDVWDNGILDDGPGHRTRHSAVWTGSELIVWGGTNGQYYHYWPYYLELATGSRYDPLLDVWTSITTQGAPDDRCDHTAVWTGSEMIVWGGTSGAARVDGLVGGRYDPVADTWEEMSTTGEPSGRVGHTAVWTGSEMIVWGGWDGDEYSPVYRGDGGRYDPSTDSWTPVPLPGWPFARRDHTAVWTGSEMIVWGGFDGSSYLDDGGSFVPATNHWSPTKEQGAPDPRSRHVAVWTGSRMIVWGGFNGVSYLDSGAVYSLQGQGSWDDASTVDAPGGRADTAAVWTGTEMMVWGGFDGAPLDTGGRYALAGDTWTPTAPLNAPSARTDAPAVWTGSLMLVAGGETDAGIVDTGGRYDPGLDAWTPTAAAPAAPEGRFYHTAVWTGNLMVVWGGYGPEGRLDTGGRYDPLLDTWTPTSLVNAPDGRMYHTAVWTGREMLIWGGGTVMSQTLDSGGRYDPVADSWQPTSMENAPSARRYHTAVWTGSLMVVWGGQEYNYLYLDTGGRYDPLSDTWLATSLEDAPGERIHHSAVWDGDEMLVWGGYQRYDMNQYRYLDDGGRYEPTSDTWVELGHAGLPPAARSRHDAVWTGSEMIVWGGKAWSGWFADGGRYDPEGDLWDILNLSGAPIPKAYPSVVWTGAEMVVWGGSVDEPPDVGARYDPVADAWVDTSLMGAPLQRVNHTAVWTGRHVIVWGGYSGHAQRLMDGGRYALHQSADLDGDAVTVCDGDCNDLEDTVSPGASELFDGLDNDCDGTVDEGHDPTPDADGDGWYVGNGDCADDDPSVRPGIFERCNLEDDDCDGTIDEGYDRDHDGYTSCGGDCDDQRPESYPGATELWDCRDNDCDGTIDEGLPDPEVDWDGDGYSICDGDCDDGDEDIRPGVQEICDGIDNDCDGSADEWFDFDGDGFVFCFDNCPRVYNPGQENEDEDPRGDACDCALGDTSIWSFAVIRVDWIDDVTLAWETTDPGGDTVPTFDLLYSSDASDFGATQATCLESDTSVTSRLHGDSPVPGGSFYYLVRGQNDCGDSLGQNSSGAERPGRNCP